jgi:hypothetical protein
VLSKRGSKAWYEAAATAHNQLWWAD